MSGAAAQAIRPERSELPAARNKHALIEAAAVLYLLAGFEHLLPADRAVLVALARHLGQEALEDGRALVWPSVPVLALGTGHTERQVWRSLARLEAAGLIRRFQMPGRRTPYTDLAGFCAVAGAALDAYAAAKTRLRCLPGGKDTQPGTNQERSSGESPPSKPADPDIESGITETDNEITKDLKQTDARTARTSRRLGEAPLAGSDATPAPKPQNPDTEKPAPLLPKEAGSEAGAKFSPPASAETIRTRLLDIEQASPTLCRLFGSGEIETLPLETLISRIRHDYIGAIGNRRRNPGHIWDWAVNRHGLDGAMLGWMIASDLPAADGTPRNPAGWFTRFATAERAWNLAGNLARLRREAARSGAPWTRGRDEARPDDEFTAEDAWGLLADAAVSDAPKNRNDKSHYGKSGEVEPQVAGPLPEVLAEPVPATPPETLKRQVSGPAPEVGATRDLLATAGCGAVLSARDRGRRDRGATDAGMSQIEIDRPNGTADAAPKVGAIVNLIPGSGFSDGRPPDFGRTAAGPDRSQATPPPDIAMGGFRQAWIAEVARFRGPGRAGAAWAAWFDQARLLAPSPGDRRLRLCVKTSFAAAHIQAQHGDACDAAARRLGYEGCEIC